MTANVAHDVEDVIAYCTAALRKRAAVPDGKPSDTIDRVVGAGVNYIVAGTIVDDEVYRPVTGFIYRSQRIKDMVQVLCTVIGFNVYGGLPPKGVEERLYKYFQYSQ